MITDRWPGVDYFFTPQREILIASSAEEIVDHLRCHPPADCKRIGNAMRKRALRVHTYEGRVKAVDSILKASTQKPAENAVAVIG
jgi:spore maturation protein CgeB